MLVGGQVHRVEIPHEHGHWIEIRKLSWKQLGQARKKAAEDQREEAKAWGAEFIAALSKGNVDEERARRLLEERRYDESNYDRESLLRLSLGAWSYDAPITEDMIGQLDEVTARWAAQTIINLTRPPSEADVKNA